MKSINITNAKNNFYKLVSDVNVGLGPITIVNNKGKNAVLISESIKKIKNSEDWHKTNEYKKDEEW